MADDETTLKGRVTRQGEEAIGRLAQELLESPVVSGALSAAFETRERAMRAQEIAMGALNIPSAADLERLTRRVRSVSQRLEGIEDGLDRLDERLARASASQEIDERLTRIEAMLERLELERPEPESVPAAPVRPASTGTARSSAARSSAVTRAKSAAKTTGSRSGGGRSGRAASGQSRTRKPAGG